MAWLKTEDVYQKYIEAVNGDGDVLGYIHLSEARKLNLKILRIEKPQKFIKDPYIKYHAEILMRNGTLTTGNDLNAVQTIILLGYIVKEKQEEAERHKINFEQMLFANSPEMYKTYREKEEQRLQAENPELEQIRPQNLQELLAMFDAFNEDAESLQEKKGDSKLSGWLDDILDAEEQSQIRD